MEMNVSTAIPEEASLFAVAFDANGRRIAYKNGSNEGSTLLIDGYEISTVTVYICDISKYRELSEMIEKEAKFKTIVMIEE